MKYAHVIAEILKAPWSIRDEYYGIIANLLAVRESGERFTEEEIRERVGARKEQRAPFAIDGESGARLEFEAAISAAASGNGSARNGKLVAVLPVYGIIMPRACNFDISTSGTGIDQLTAQFRAAVRNPDIKAIVLDFDSPGGSVYGVDELASEIFAAREQKKIVAQVNPLCASAAYYLASQCSEIAGLASGEVGSLGVRSMHQDLSKALEMKGVKVTYITYGKYKVEGNPAEPLGEDAMAFMQQRVNEYGEMFVKAVARGRDQKASDVKSEFGEGRVYGMAEAKRRGMIDRIATLDDTLARLGVASDGARVSMSASASTEVQNTASAETPTEVLQMPDITPTTAAAAADSFRAEYSAEILRCERIMQLAKAHNLIDKAAAWIADPKKSVEAVQGEILASLKPIVVHQPSAEQRAEATATVIVDAADKLPADQLFGRIVRTFAAAKGNRRDAAAIATHVFHDAKVASMFEAAVDPQRASDFASGGFLLGDNISTSVIELLRPKSVVRSLNPTLAPLVDGVLTLPKITGGATASYLGETKQIKATKIVGGQVKASAKTLGAIVVITNKLMRSPSANADTLVRNDAIRAIAQAEDVSFLRNKGTEYSPKGLLFWKGAGSFSANTTVNLANVTADLVKAITTLEEANVDMTTCGWVMAPRTKGYLMQIRDGNGNYAFKDEMSRGMLLGYPFRQTSQIPKNLGTGNDSEIYFAAFADVVVADAPQIAIEYTSEASIDDGAGNVTPLFQTDMSAIKVLMEHDLIVRHSESVVVIDTVRWY